MSYFISLAENLPCSPRNLPFIAWLFPARLLHLLRAPLQVEPVRLQFYSHVPRRCPQGSARNCYVTVAGFA